MEKYLDTEEPKEREPGIRLEYQLKTEEVYGVLKRSKFYRKAMLKAKIETAVLGAMTLLFGLTWLLNEDINAMIFAIASAVLIGLVWATPYGSLRTQAIKWANKQDIEMEICPHGILVGSGAEQWEIPLDGTVAYEEYENLMVLHTAQEELTIIPLRCIAEHQMAEVQARIQSGTCRQESPKAQ